MNVTEQDQPKIHSQQPNGPYITYNIPNPNQPSYPPLSSQPSELKAYIREHALKYVKTAPKETDEAYPKWHEKLIKIEKVVYTKYMKKWSNQQQAPQQQQQQQPSSPTPSSSNSSNSSSSSRNTSSNDVQSDYEHLKHKYNELLMQQKSINDIQSKFRELEQYNLILLEQQNNNVTMNQLQGRICELQKENEVQSQMIQLLLEEKTEIKLENDTLRNLNITLEAQREQYENGKLLMQLEQIKYVQKYEKLEKQYAELMLKDELREIKMNKLQHEYKDLEMKYNGKLKIQKIADYVEWNAEQIVNWIINGDKERFGKYTDVLLRNMKKEGIDGYCIDDLDKTDLYRLGITQFKDKKDIYHNIRILVETKEFGEGIEDKHNTDSV